jgi:abortive infection bacteriophage resistance protein
VLSRLYENLKRGETKRDIADVFGLSDKAFASWIHGFVYVRNVCAHHARLWNRSLQIQPLFPRHTKYTWIAIEEVSNRRMYYILSMIIYFLDRINFTHTFREKLNDLFAQYPHVDRGAMGFPSRWKNEPLWQSSFTSTAASTEPPP